MYSVRNGRQSEILLWRLLCRAVHTVFVTLQKYYSIIEALIHILWAVVW
jgi:hypothetical protein